MTTERVSSSTNSVQGRTDHRRSRGQGAAHARRLASDGAVVYIADVLDEVGEAEASRLQADGLDVTYLHLDISDEDSWQSAMKTIAVERGRLDVLVNNAGVIHVTPIAEEDLTAWKRLLDINLTGAFLGIRAALPLLEASGGGSDHQHLVDFRPRGCDRLRRIRRQQGRSARSYSYGGTGVGGEEHSRQRCLPGRCQHTDERERTRRWCRPGNAARAARQTHPRSPARLPSWRAAIRRSSPAQSSSSTAGSWPIEPLCLNGVELIVTGNSQRRRERCGADLSG